MIETDSFDLVPEKKGFIGPTFSLANRLKRLVWEVTWLLAARWTPPPLHRWRILILRIFGAQVSWTASVYSNVEIWAPWHLVIEDYGALGRGVTCYNMAPISIGVRAVVSQGSHLCAGTHAYRDPAFPLVAKSITIGPRAWICADAFVGPGVTVGAGAILAARGVTFDSLKPWNVYIGNPAVILRSRPVMDD